MFYFNLGGRVYIYLTEIWRKKVQGLCGNFDFDAMNDLTSKRGIIEIPQKCLESWADSTCTSETGDIEPCKVITAFIFI